jgi:hypothetical protein
LVGGNVRSGVLWTADIISAFEALQRRWVSQGASGYTGNGRDNGAGNGKIPGFDKMSFEQQRHAQEQILSRSLGIRSLGRILKAFGVHSCWWRTPKPPRGPSA